MKVLLFVALFALSSCKEDTSRLKEASYKKYVGEKDYTVPFTAKLTDKFEVGHTIHVVGTIAEKPKSIDFDFHHGASKTNIPHHFQIRFDGIIFSAKFIYSAFKNGNFTKEQTISKFSSPFKAGQEFDLRVRILEKKFQIFANRVKIGEFNIVEPLDGVDHVSISGDLKSLRLFHYGGGNLAIPYSARAPLTPGQRLDVSGLSTGKRYNVNLYKEKNKEAALQLSVRFGEKAIVRNAQVAGVWGKEEREGKVPINKGEVFDLTIINEPYSFQIFFDGKRFGTFAHRGDPKDVKTLEIDGDVELHTVTINPTGL